MTKKHYLTPTDLYERAEKRLSELYKERKLLEKASANHPTGKIHIVNSKGRIQYYVRTDSEDKSGTYISKAEKDKIKAYLQKRYDEQAIRKITKEINNLESFVKGGKGAVSDLRELYSDYPKEIKEVLSPVDISDEDFAREWLSRTYEGKTISKDTPAFLSEKGDRVRSKSELMIANKLFYLEIPYKYECPFTLSTGRIIYPDFTVLDIKRRREIYWEHRGMMDDREYSKHSVQRIKDYGRDKVFLGDNLIITEETSISPLGIDEIERLIQHYFLADEY